MNQNFNIIPSNCQNEGYENFITGNNYPVGLQQARDVTQTEQSFPNNQVHYANYNGVNPLNNCFFTSNEPNLSTQQHENVGAISDHDKQPPMSPYTPHIQLPFSQPSQYYPQISVPKQQLIFNNVNTRQFPNQNPQLSNNGLHDSSTNANYIELFKFEISGMEIIIRQKSRSNWEKQQQVNEQQPPLNLTNRIERTQNRMHPYNMPNEQNYRRNSNIFRQQQQQHHHCYSMRQQRNDVSEIDRTSLSENTNNINITQNTLVNQSAVFTRQQTNSFEECNNLINQEL
jgi:hypothetical protein